MIKAIMRRLCRIVTRCKIIYKRHGNDADAKQTLPTLLTLLMLLCERRC